MKSDRKQTILFIIILLVLSMGIGYAFLTTTLSIDGTSDIDSATWDIHWENIDVYSGSVSGDNVISPAIIGSNGTSINYHVKLDIGTYYAFTVDAVNDGTLYAKIDDIIITLNGERDFDLPNYLLFFYKYEDESDIRVGDLLAPGESIKMLFAIRYNDRIQPSDLPIENQSFDLSIDFVYSQASTRNYYLSSNTFDYTVSMFSPIPNISNSYNSYQLALNNSNYPFFIKLYTIDNRIKDISLGFLYNNQVYYLKGLDPSAYESNQNLLVSLFGEENCSYRPTGYYDCVGNDITYTIDSHGYVAIDHSGDAFECFTHVTTVYDENYGDVEGYQFRCASHLG